MSSVRLLLCSCADSQSVDPASAAAATGADETVRCRELCGADRDQLAASLGAASRTVVAACEQQRGQFATTAAELGASDRLSVVDIRDRAGWTADGEAHAKQAALLTAAALPAPLTPQRSVASAGVTLVLGGEAALAAAAALADDLAVTALLDPVPESLVPTDAFDLATGRVRTVAGALGSFRVTVDGYAPATPSGRGATRFEAPIDGATSSCDVILDLTGGAPLVPAPHKRNGYLRADPGDPAAVERAIRSAAALVGEFEHPLSIRFDALICAHSRAGQPGCRRCLDVCPTGAISPAGESVAIDPAICAGCGACAAVCPSGAASYDDPPPEHLFARLSTLAATFREASDEAPRALFHDAEFGAELIALSARFGRGLPADVIAVAVPNVALIGHAELLAALGAGFAAAVIVAGPRAEREVIGRELALATAILEGVGREAERVGLIEPVDPDALEAALYGRGPAAHDAEILPLGGRREVTRLAATALAEAPITEPIALPGGAPYGAITIDAEACTLCLACVSLCPVGALGDNPDKPQVSIQESACVQCGICASACPERAIALTPQLDLSPSALARRTLNEEEPFACIECGKPFGVAATIEKIVAKLENQHWMFTNSDNVRLIKMCEDCRVNAQYHAANSPFRLSERPRPRTTEDELAARKKLN